VLRSTAVQPQKLMAWLEQSLSLADEFLAHAPEGG